MIPKQPALEVKGIAVAIADGISSSEVSRIASETAVKSLLTDYYCTPDSWSVKTSVHRVLAATNSWLHGQNSRGQYEDDRNRGLVCTLSAIVLKSRTAHIFHVGDSRIYRLHEKSLEALTADHRVVMSSTQSYLARALGVNANVEVDYRAVPLQIGDVFVLATDGIYEHVEPRSIIHTLEARRDDLQGAAAAIAAEALANGSPDNLTVQIIVVNELPDGMLSDILEETAALSPLPLPQPRMVVDGYEIIRQIHANNRSHIFMASDRETGDIVAIKFPSTDMREEAADLRRLRMEEWIARRINNAHVLKAPPLSRKRSHLYAVMEFIEGQTLAQRMIDQPETDLETIRTIVEQVANGLYAFHRMEMVHRDLRPANIMIDKTGTVRIIDFGSTLIAGVAETDRASDGEEILGTVQYTAPECFLGEAASPRSDLFSLGVIAYQMLTGRLPFGNQSMDLRTRKAQRRLRYIPAAEFNPDVPNWMDAALRKAVNPDPAGRYAAISEFTFDMRHPNPALMGEAPPPLLERNPNLFWKAISATLLMVVLILLWRLSRT
ncbi:Protein kinase [Chelatococcus asaccharovorans]|nr:Protein kinase [Chelatococcus asaccharovorans]CAH1689483.1 Protein kinase [Chelatococcus asaccharovorans]